MPKAIAIVSPSPFNSLSTGAVADELGSVKAQIAELQDREKALRDELIRRGISEIAGSAYCASITETVRWILDTKAVKAEMGQGWYYARCRQGMLTTVVVKALAAPTKLAARRRCGTNWTTPSICRLPRCHGQRQFVPSTATERLVIARRIVAPIRRCSSSRQLSRNSTTSTPG